MTVVVASPTAIGSSASEPGTLVFTTRSEKCSNAASSPVRVRPCPLFYDRLPEAVRPLASTRVPEGNSTPGSRLHTPNVTSLSRTRPPHRLSCTDGPPGTEVSTRPRRSLGARERSSSSVVFGTHETTRRSVPVPMAVGPHGYSTRSGSPPSVRFDLGFEGVDKPCLGDRRSPGDRTSRLPSSSIPNRERRRPVRVRSGTRPGGPRRFRLAVSTGSQRGVE